MELRPYQEEAKESIFEEWDKGVQKTLLVPPHPAAARLWCLRKWRRTVCAAGTGC